MSSLSGTRLRTANPCSRTNCARMCSATPKQSLIALWLWRGSLVLTICPRTRVLWISWLRLRTRRSWRRWICFGCLGCRGGERDWRGLPDLMRGNERIKCVIDSVMEGLARCWRCLLACIAGLERDVRERGFYSWVCFYYPQAFSGNGFIFSVAYIAFKGFSCLFSKKFMCNTPSIFSFILMCNSGYITHSLTWLACFTISHSTATARYA